MVSKADIKWAESRLKLILSFWEDDPTLSLRQIVNACGICHPDKDIRGNKVEALE